MCDPLSVTLTGLGAAKSAAEVVAGNDSLAAQGKSAKQQAESSYLEAQYDHQQQAKAALEEGYVAEMERRNAVSQAKVRNAGRGIRGATADEVVVSEVQVGNFNVASAENARRKADTAYTIGTGITQANATTQVKNINAQMTSGGEALFAVATGGLQGYLTGAPHRRSKEGSGSP